MPLALSNLHGFNVGGEISSDIVATYRGNDDNFQNALTYNTTPFTLGPAAADKVVVAIVAGANNATSNTIAVAGVSIPTVATFTQLASVSYLNNYLGIWAAVVPGVSSASLRVQYTDTSKGLGIGVYTLTNVSTLSPTDTAVDNGSPASDVIDVVAGGVIIAGGITANKDSVHTWTGLTEDDDNIGHTGSFDFTLSLASLQSAIAETDRAFTCDGTVEETYMLAVALR